MSDSVQNNAKTTSRKAGGVTGKGFQPGRSGNPAGRPKTKVLTEGLRSYLAEHPEQLQGMVEKIVAQAQSGDVRAFQAIADRLEGKPMQQMQLSGEITVLSEAFERMSKRELEEYARTGTLPPWFPHAEEETA